MRCQRRVSRSALTVSRAKRDSCSCRSSSAPASAACVGPGTVLYGLLRTLEQCGEVAKEQLPGGSTGYRLRLPAPAEPFASPPESTES
jgi:hypothetical protein